MGDKNFKVLLFTRPLLGLLYFMDFCSCLAYFELHLKYFLWYESIAESIARCKCYTVPLLMIRSVIFMYKKVINTLPWVLYCPDVYDRPCRWGMASLRSQTQLRQRGHRSRDMPLCTSQRSTEPNLLPILPHLGSYCSSHISETNAHERVTCECKSTRWSTLLPIHSFHKVYHMFRV